MVDYRRLFSESLILVGKGMSVKEALETCARKRYPLTFRDILANSERILEALKRENDWGEVRALREASSTPGLAEKILEGIPPASDVNPERREREPVAADYPRLLRLAQRKRRTGYSLEDSLEMAARELYPQIFRKVKEAAVSIVRAYAEEEGVHELRALKELAEDPSLLRTARERLSR
jgi:hypothetical protein